MGILRAISAEPVSAAERLRKAIAAFVRRALAGPALAYAFIAEPVEGEVDAERIRGRRLFGEVFRQLLAEGVAAGEFPEQSLDAAAACIVGAFTEALVGPVAPSRHDPQQGEQLVEAICGFCLRAAGARGPG